jgi:hypothetical protein
MSHIRKQVYELTVADLQQTPVWEFALDEEGVEGQDEATVRPYASRGPLDMPEGAFIVRARFDLADGTTVSGFLTPPGLDTETFDLGIIQPVVVTRRGQVSFWHGIVTPKPQEIGESYSKLGKQSHQQVFPIRFESDVPLEKPVSGKIPGFLVLEDWRAGRTRTLM